MRAVLTAAAAEVEATVPVATATEAAGAAPEAGTEAATVAAAKATRRPCSPYSQSRARTAKRAPLAHHRRMCHQPRCRRTSLRRAHVAPPVQTAVAMLVVLAVRWRPTGAAQVPVAAACHLQGLVAAASAVWRTAVEGEPRDTCANRPRDSYSTGRGTTTSRIRLRRRRGPYTVHARVHRRTGRGQ